MYHSENDTESTPLVKTANAVATAPSAPYQYEMHTIQATKVVAPSAVYVDGVHISMNDDDYDSDDVDINHFGKIKSKQINDAIIASKESCSKYYDDDIS